MNAYLRSPTGLSRRIERNVLTRRDTLWLVGASLSTSILLQGCATSPVSGKRILVGISESQEIAIDRAQSPHQFSADLGAVQNMQVNAYLSEIGQRVHAQTERAGLPYSYRALNANYVNAYTFPAGAVGITRGILVELQDESELAALIGHELGHVNARHAAQRQGQALLAQVALAGLAASTERSDWAPLIGLGALGDFGVARKLAFVTCNVAAALAVALIFPFGAAPLTYQFVASMTVIASTALGFANVLFNS